MFSIFSKISSMLTLIVLILFCTTARSLINQPLTPVKPTIDTKTYKYITLENDLKVLLVSDPEAKLSSAALQVGVGYSSDPRDIPGLAHFLEHMLFMGSEKYPDTSHYMTYVHLHAGKTNAFTDFDRTNYFFQISSDLFEPALDMFSQFFTSPLFNDTTVKKEANAVNSEFEKTFQMQGFRDLYLLQIVSNKSTSFSKFGCGNYESLIDAPSQNGVDTRQRLIQFYDKYYSANLMSLVLTGNHSISTLEAMAEEKFKMVKNIQTSMPLHGLEDLLPDLPKIILSNPINDEHTLKLMFPVPYELSDFKVKAYDYLDKQLKYKGKGSIYEFFTKNGWIKNIRFVRIGQNKELHLYIISYDLNQEGLNHIFEILQWTFGLITKVQREGVSEARFVEYAAEAKVRFDYFPTAEEPFMVASKLASDLLEYGIENVLSAQTLMQSYDRHKTKTFLRAFSIENCLIEVASKSFEYRPDNNSPIIFDTTTRKLILNSLNKHYEPFRTYYAEETFPSEALLQLKKFNPTYLISLSPENPFIPSNFELLTPQVNLIDAKVAPTKIVDRQGLELWHSQFSYHNSPITYAVFDLYSWRALLNIEDQAAFTVLHKVIQKKFVSVSSQLEEVGYKVEQEFGQEHITVTVSGMSGKFAKVCSTLFSQLKNLSLSKKEFEILKEEAITDLKNVKFELLFRTAARRIRLNQKKYSFFSEDILDSLLNLSFTDFRAKLIHESLSVSGIVLGNIDQNTVKELALSLETILSLRTRKNDRISQEYANVEGNSFVVQDWSPFNDSSEQCIVSYYNFRDNTPESTAALSIVNSLLSQHLFNSLRTVKQLGYVVGSIVERELPMTGVMIVVQGSKEDPRYFNAEIEQALYEVEENIKNISNEEFDSLKQNHQNQKLQDQKDFADKAKRWMQQIRQRRYQFDEDERAISYIEATNSEKLLNVYKRLFKEGGKFSYQFYVRKQNEDEVSTESMLEVKQSYAKREEKLIKDKTDLKEYF